MEKRLGFKVSCLFLLGLQVVGSLELVSNSTTYVKHKFLAHNEIYKDTKGQSCKNAYFFFLEGISRD